METLSNLPPDDWETMERYVLDDMNPAERSSFEERLAANAALRTRLDEAKLLLLGMQEAELRKRMKDFHQSPQTQQKQFRIGQKNRGSRIWLLAASLLLVLGVGSLLLLRNGGNEGLFTAYFKPDPGLMTTMGATDTYAFDRAMVDYKRGNYKAAILSWDGLQKTQPANDTLNYFLGVSYLANGNAKEAVAYLQKVTVLPQSFFYGDAWWYQGLALLKEGKKGEAMAAIEKSTHPEKGKLLQKLKRQ